jgi:hypothetical protein
MTTHEPGYDFFATGAPAPAAPPAPSGFGTVAPPAPAPAPVPVPAPAPVAPTGPVVAAGYTPGAVNQFGTPLDTPSVPTGPYAAPGIGAAPTAGPGLVSSWDAAPPAGSPAPPAWGAAPVGHRAASRPTPRPGTVLAAGIVAIVVGALALVLGVVGMVAYAAISSELAAFENAPELAGADLDMSGLTTMMLVGVVVLLASGALYLVAGIATAAGRRWGAWTLIVVSVVSIVMTLVQMVTGSGGNGLLGIVVSAVVAGLLLTPAAQAWLRSPA